MVGSPGVPVEEVRFRQTRVVVTLEQVEKLVIGDECVTGPCETPGSGFY